MKRGRRTLRPVLFAVLLAVLLAGCGRNTAPGGAPGSAQASLPGSAAGEETAAPAASGGDADPPGTVRPVNPEPEPGKLVPDWDSLFTQESVVERNVHTDFYYRAFQRDAAATWLVPGLAQGFVPQGMDVWRERGLLLISGYFPDRSVSDSSMLFALDLRTGNLAGEYSLRNPDGSPHTSHVGGVAVAGGNLYLSNSGRLLRVDLAQLATGAPKAALAIRESIPVPVRASFCNYSGGLLWVGDFYILGNASYATDQSHHMTSRTGAEHGAWCVGYRLTDETESGFRPDSRGPSGEMVPDVILSIDQKIQGVAVVGPVIALSQSYGRTNDSKILLYENPLDTEPHRTVELDGREVPLWFLDGALDTDLRIAPPMSQGLAEYNGQLLILFESGAACYREDGGRNPTDRVWVMTLPKD